MITYISETFYYILEEALSTHAIGHYSCINRHLSGHKLSFFISLYQEDDTDLDEGEALEMIEDLQWQTKLIHSLNRLNMYICIDFYEEDLDIFPDEDIIISYLDSKDIKGLVSYIQEVNAGIEPIS